VSSLRFFLAASSRRRAPGCTRTSQCRAHRTERSLPIQRCNCLSVAPWCIVQVKYTIYLRIDARMTSSSASGCRAIPWLFRSKMWSDISTKRLVQLCLCAKADTPFAFWYSRFSINVTECPHRSVAQPPANQVARYPATSQISRSGFPGGRHDMSRTHAAERHESWERHLHRSNSAPVARHQNQTLITVFMA